MRFLLMLLILTGCTRFDALNVVVPPFGYQRTRAVAYGPLPTQKLDVYQPKGLKAPAGIVVFFYGGDWQSGRRDDYRFVAQALASRGFVVVLPDYRLYPEAAFPTFVHDGAAAVRWAHDHAPDIGGDPGRLFLMGHSAGAHIAALLTLDPRYFADVGLEMSAVRATAALSGPFDFVPPPGDRGVFGLAENETKTAPEAQPITFADHVAPPMLLIHGDADVIVRPENTDRLADRLAAAGSRVNTLFYKGKGHVPVVLAFAWPFRWLAPALDDVTAYFNGFAPSP